MWRCCKHRDKKIVGIKLFPDFTWKSHNIERWCWQHIKATLHLMHQCLKCTWPIALPPQRCFRIFNRVNIHYLVLLLWKSKLVPSCIHQSTLLTVCSCLCTSRLLSSQKRSVRNLQLHSLLILTHGWSANCISICASNVTFADPVCAGKTFLFEEKITRLGQKKSSAI